MNNAGPIFDPTTRYRIELRGRVDVEWLQSFDGLAESIVIRFGRVFCKFEAINPSCARRNSANVGGQSWIYPHPKLTL
jgi:hypothetical protein